MGGGPDPDPDPPPGSAHVWYTGNSILHKIVHEFTMETDYSLSCYHGYCHIQCRSQNIPRIILIWKKKKTFHLDPSPFIRKIQRSGYSKKSMYIVFVHNNNRTYKSIYETVGTCASTRIDVRYIEKLGTAIDMWIKLLVFKYIQISIHIACIYTMGTMYTKIDLFKIQVRNFFYNVQKYKQK